MPYPKTQYVQFTGLANKANPATGRPAVAVRYASYNGHQHVVVPVVALVGDSVIYPLGATCPELVPASVLSVAPETWNQRPVLPDHPVTLGFLQASGSANDPVILESAQFGQLFNFAFRNGALQGEMWLDPIKATQVGRQASDIIAKCLRGEQVEVSIGAFITAIEESGVTATGKEYGVRWTSVRSDHLALGLQGKDGACDASMGCGANRSLAENSENGSSSENGDEMKVDKRTTLYLQRSAMSASIPSGMTDSNLRELLETALKAKEPKASYLWVPAIYLADLRVVYSVSYGDSGPSEKFERAFTIEGEVVTVSDIKTPVVEKTTYEPKPAALSALSSLSLRQRFDGAMDYLRSALGVTDEESAEPELSVALIPLSEAMRGLSSALSTLSPSAISAIRSAAGARHNATDQRMLQSAHAQAHDLHDQLTALGAACDSAGVVKGMAAGDSADPVKEKVLTGEKPACKCGKITVAGSENSTEGAPGDPAAATEHEGGSTMAMSKEAAAAVTRMLAGNSPSVDADVALLKAEGVEIPATPAKVEVKAAAAESVSTAAKPEVTEEEWLRTAPESIRSLVSRQQTQEAAQRKALIANLVAARPKIANLAAELEKRSTDDLILMSELAHDGKGGEHQVTALSGLPMDYSGRGGPVVRQPEGAREAKEVPRPYSAALGKNILTGEKVDANGHKVVN